MGSEIAVQVGIGVISGILLSTIAYVTRFSSGQVLSILVSAMSDARSVKGKWQTTFWRGRDKQKESAQLWQLGNRVWGNIKFSKNGAPRVYRMRGTIKEGILVATYEITGERSIKDRGAFTLGLGPNGQTLKGCSSWTDDQTDAPMGDKYEWKKSAS